MSDSGLQSEHGRSNELREVGDDGEIIISQSEDETRLVIPRSYIMRLGELSGPDRARNITFECSVCEDIKCETSAFEHGAWGKRSIEEMEEGARKGCRYCQLLAKGIRSCVPHVELTEAGRLSARLARTLPHGKAAQPPNKYGVDIFKLPGDDSTWMGHAVPVGDIPSGDTETSAAVETAKGWLELCVSTHEECGNGEDKPAPSRLVDVNPDDSSGIKLVEQGGTPCRYAALSHCWGKTGSITTTADDLEQRKAGIPWSALCATFQDAVTITRRLGLRYIWIDSLCIIQDSKEDWQKEAGQMASIYESAYVTIAATRSSSHDSGCFAKTSPEFKSHKVSITDSDGSELTLYFRRMMPHCPYIIQSPEQADEFPLLNRGWAYQERLLSPRVLHYFNNEIAWECMRTSSCECGNPNGNFSDGMRPPFNRPQINKAENPKTAHRRDLRPGRSIENLTRRWHDTVKEYTGLKLTYEKDALPALAGLARQMQRRREGDEYLAGLWSGTLFYDILWSAEDDRAPRPKEYRGPSWSWVTTTSPVNYERAHVFAIRAFYPKFLGSKVSLAGPDPYGEVERPTCVILQGLLAEGQLQYTNHKEGANQGNEGQGQGQKRKSDYDIIVGGKAVGPFDADYGLRLDQGCDYIPDGFYVKLLLFAKSDNNFFYLVLINVSLSTSTNYEERRKNPVIVSERIGLLTIARMYEPLHEREGVETWTEERIILR